jgi:malonyl-CoA decarboxylase
MDTTFFADLLTTISERGRAVLGRSGGNGASAVDLPELCQKLVSRRGEASGVAIASEILARGDALGGDERKDFMLHLAHKFGPDVARLERAIVVWQKSQSAEALIELHAAAEPKRQELIRRLNLSPGGTQKLVRMREELFRHRGRHPALTALEADFAHLLSSWFNRGFLVLRRIDWSTPANILEKIIRYEAVHAIGDWDDLRRRIEPEDRRLFAFFHPQMVDEPLIFVQVALTDHIPDAIEPLLHLERATMLAGDATTAVFYSISNCQEGLKGISFGSFLIKQVVEDLKRELPRLRTFVTLSPVPGFASWLARERAKGAPRGLDESCRAALAALEDRDWASTDDKVEQLRVPLLSAAALYLVESRNPNGKPIDPVARFHLRNGARLERLNFLADRSAKGFSQAHGIMVNYLYDHQSIEKNREAFAEMGEVVTSRLVRRRMQNCMPSRHAD